MAFGSESDLTKTEISIVSIAIIKQLNFQLQQFVLDTNNSFVGRSYKNNDKNINITYFYPTSIELNSVHNPFETINQYKDKLSQDDLPRKLLIPISIENHYALIEMDLDQNKKAHTRIFTYSNSEKNHELTTFIQQNLTGIDPNTIESRHPYDENDKVVNIPKKDTGVIICEQLESIVNADGNYVRDNLVRSRKKYQTYFKEETRGEDSPWYMYAANIGLQTAPIGAAIGFLVGNMPGALIGAALGSVAGFAIGTVISMIDTFRETIPKFATKFSLEQFDQEENDKEKMYEKTWYKPSRTKVFGLDIRFFMGAAAGAAIGGAIGTLIFPVVGTIIGAGIGTLLSGVAAIVHPIIAAKTARGKEIPLTRKWNQESTYDVPWFSRAFVGATTGAALGAMVGSIIPGVGTIIGGAVGTLIGASATILSPGLFAGARKLFSSNQANEHANENANPQQEKDPNTAKRHWYKQSMFDMSWYVRLLAGGLGGLTLGAAIGTVIFPGVGTLIGGLLGFALVGGGAIASPFMFNLAKKYIDKVPENNVANINSIDIPWYIRFFAGASAGASIGAALGTVVPVIGNIIGAVVGASLGTIAALASPAIKELWFSPQAAPYQAKPDMLLSLPWYLRAAVGAMSGAAIGGAAGTFIPILGVGTALGAVVGTLLGATIALVAPVIPYFKRQITEKNLKELEQTLREIPKNEIVNAPKDELENSNQVETNLNWNHQSDQSASVSAAQHAGFFHLKKPVPASLQVSQNLQQDSEAPAGPGPDRPTL